MKNNFEFLIQKPVFFRKVKDIKHLSGGVVLYAAQTNVQIDAEIAEKDGFWTETILICLWSTTPLESGDQAR